MIFFKIKEDLMGEELFDFLKGHFKIKKNILANMRPVL